MKSTIQKFCIVVLLAINFNSGAQNILKGPHGGLIQPVKGYYIEAMGCDEYLEIYLFNNDMMPLLNYGTTGNVRFYKDASTSEASALVYYSNDGFTAKFPNYYFPYFDVTLELPDKKLLLRFKNECLPR